MKPVFTSHGAKFDFQLSNALVRERRLAEIFKSAAFAHAPKFELKSESYQWERTGNIALEYRQNGAPSGIAVTEADFWVHELLRGNETLVYLMFPIERLKMLARDAYARGDICRAAGDGQRFEIVKLPLRDILK